MGPLFYVSERENAFNTTLESIRPKVAWRDHCVAFAWSSLSSPVTANKVVALRIFNDIATTPVVVPLSLSRSGGNLVISWPSSATGYTLRSRANLSSGNWQTNSPAPVVSGGSFTVTEPIGSNAKFYQLIR